MNGLWATRRGTRLVRKGLVFAVFALASASASAVPAIDEDVPDRGIFSLRPAPRWDEGLLIGNGRMGGVVLGRPGDEAIHLSHERVVIPNHVAKPPPKLAHLLFETRQLIREGKREEAAQMVWEESRRIAGWNGLVWTDPFVNACNLEIKLPGLAEPDAYRRSLDYETGVARVQWVGGETRYEERAFLSRPDNAMVLELTAAGKKKLAGVVALKAGAHPYHHRVKDEQLLSEEGWLTYRCGYQLTDGVVFLRLLPLHRRPRLPSGSCGAVDEGNRPLLRGLSRGGQEWLLRGDSQLLARARRHGPEHNHGRGGDSDDASQSHQRLPGTRYREREHRQVASHAGEVAAARKAVADKAAVRCRDKKGGVMGFGTVQIGLAAASLRDAEMVWRVIDNLSTLYWFPTFAAAHNCGQHGPEIFNADICGGLPAVMIDMLVQSKPGEITLLPALPDNLPRGTLEGALLRGAITVERLEWSPDSVTVELRSPKTQEVTLRTGPRAVSLTLNENRSVRRSFARRSRAARARPPARPRLADRPAHRCRHVPGRRGREEGGGVRLHSKPIEPDQFILLLRRAIENLVRVHCAAPSETLFESEFFGHRRSSHQSPTLAETPHHGVRLLMPSKTRAFANERPGIGGESHLLIEPVRGTC